MIAGSDIKRSLLRVIVLVAVIFELVGIVAQNLATASLLEGRTVGGSHAEAASPPFAAHERLQVARGPQGGAPTAHAIRWLVDRRPASRAQVSDGSVGRVHVVRLRGGLDRALTSSGGTLEMASGLPAPASRFTANGRWLHWTTPARGYDHPHDAIHDFYVVAAPTDGADGAAGAAVLVHNVDCGRITGYTTHGLDQAIRRDGHGVSVRAINDAVRNPTKVVKQAERGTTKYVDRDATVVLNEDGKVVTTYARNRNGWRH